MPQAPYNQSKTDQNASSYIGIDTLQEQIRVKALRSGFTLNMMVVGRSNLGKSTLINTLFKTSASAKIPGSYEPIPKTTQIRSSTCELFEGGVKLRLTVTDTPGFGDQVNNENCWEPLIQHIKEQYQKYLEEEQKIERLLKIPDMRVHCCLYFIAPSGHELSSLDVEVLKRLSEIVNVVPVIAKADTFTIEERSAFKERIKVAIRDHGIKVYPLEEFEDPFDVSHNSKIRDITPFAVVGSTEWHEWHGKKVLGRKCRWGVIEVENKNHNDFYFLREMLIRTHMKDLVEVTSELFYEEFRRRSLTKEKEVKTSPKQQVTYRQKSK